MPIHLHHSTTVKNACSYIFTMLNITEATLLLYTIYILLLHLNTATIKQFLTWVIPSLRTVSYISNKLRVNLSASTVLSWKKDNYTLWLHTTRLAITVSTNKCTQYNTIQYNKIYIIKHNSWQVTNPYMFQHWNASSGSLLTQRNASPTCKSRHWYN